MSKKPSRSRRHGDDSDADSREMTPLRPKRTYIPQSDDPHQRSIDRKVLEIETLRVMIRDQPYRREELEGKLEREEHELQKLLSRHHKAHHHMSSPLRFALPRGNSVVRAPSRFQASSPKGSPVRASSPTAFEKRKRSVSRCAKPKTRRRRVMPPRDPVTGRFMKRCRSRTQKKRRSSCCK